MPARKSHSAFFLPIGILSFCLLLILGLPLNAAAEEILSLRLDVPVYRYGEPITGKCDFSVLEFDPDAVLQIRFRLVDIHERLLAESITETEPNREVPFSLQTGLALTDAVLLQVSLLDRDAIVTTSEKPVRLFRDGPIFPVIWRYLIKQFALYDNEQLRRMGVTSIYGNWPKADLHESQALKNALDGLTWLCQIAQLENYPETAAERNALKDHIREKAQTVADLRPFAWTIEDETRSFEAAKGPEFGMFLESRHGTLEALNAAWGKDYEKWEDAEPFEGRNAVKRGDYVRHHDTQAWRDFLFAETLKTYREAIREVVPDARVGVESRFLGNPEWTLPQLDFLILDREERENLLVRDVGRPGILMGNNIFGPVTMENLHGQRHTLLWYSALEGAGMMDFFHPGEFSKRPAPRTNPELLQKTQEDLLGGIGPMLAGARPIERKIAVYYDRVNEHVGELAPPGDDAATAQRAFLNLIGSAGFSAKMVTSKQIREGALHDGETKFLILIHTFALPDEIIEPIERFALSGGFVMADVSPGMFDGKAHLRELRPLDGFFGVDSGPVPETLNEREKFIHETKRIVTVNPPVRGVDVIPPEFDLRGIEPGIGVTTGEAMMQAGEIPVAILKQHGWGRSMLLNVTLSDGSANREDSVRILRTIFGKPLARDVPEFSVPEPSDGEGPHLYHFQRGHVRIDAFMLPEYPSLPTDDIVISIQWPASLHTYDLRTGKYLGAVSEAEVRVLPGTPVLFAQTPFQIEDLVIRVSPPTSPEKPHRVEAQLIGEGGARVTGSLLRLEVDPPAGIIGDTDGNRGAYVPLFAEVNNGIAEFEIPIALNHRFGIWHIHVTDCVSGLFRSESFSPGEREGS